MTLESELLKMERELWRTDPVLYREHLHEDAVLVFAETGVISRDFALKAIEEEVENGRPWEEVSLDDVRCVSLADDAALLTYRATARRAGEIESMKALASSVYIRRRGRWKLAFHQQSALPDTQA